VAWIIRGGLNRKYQVQSLPSLDDIAGEKENPVDVPASDIAQQANK